MQPFIYSRAKNTQEAISLLTGENVKPIGGGTNLVDLMKLNIEAPGTIVDISALDMQQIDVLADGAIRIGASVRNSDLAYHPLIRERYPVLSQALLSGASPQLRNMATVGGNLLQRTRCPYFYDTAYACNKRKQGSGCAAINGYNRSHAILGGSDYCIATHPSDMCVALAALDATIYVQSSKGNRTIAFSDFHLLPDNTPGVETALQPGELITAIQIPNLPFATASAYLKVRDRASYEFALSSAAVALDIKNGIIKDARIAMGGIGTRPWRMKRVEKLITGMRADERAYKMAANDALKNATPHKHNAFKVELAKRTLIQALAKTAGIYG